MADTRVGVTADESAPKQRHPDDNNSELWLPMACVKRVAKATLAKTNGATVGGYQWALLYAPV